MPATNAFYPEQHLRFLGFQEECAAVDKMAERVPQLVALGLTNAEAFFQAWYELHPSPLGLAPGIGPQDFYRLMVDTMILRAQMYFDDLRNTYLWTVSSRLKPHNAAWNPVDPVRLLELSQKGIGRRGTKAYNQVRWEAKMNLVAGLGFAAMELAHPERWISAEMDLIDQLSRDKLFAPTDLVPVHVVYAVDRVGNGRLVTEPRVFYKRSDALQERRRMRAEHGVGVRVYLETIECRTIYLGSDEEGWLVYVDHRRKKYFSRLLKRHDGGTVRDSCGTFYGVVARFHRDGTLTPGTRGDAEAVRQETERCLWDGVTLVKDPPSESSKRHRHPDYWDTKLVGRISIMQQTRRVYAFVEQMMTSLADYLSQQHARDALHHEIRRCEQLAMTNPDRPERTPPALMYWPEDIYPRSKWSSDATVHRLRQSWTARFAGKAKEAA